ncbi:hypothetical protein BAUCODRAFT_498590 [Baudoinia panamericana UAMH 10762]|uniref:Uncharacterized protein n=1 Tax=Baudoinia panamericana (strain UAMH 10762) TaxID=717646 RepID=M2MGB1_BAUPA|nr:uncharacterized protein BAUCODRAFT_498590 [Baudoinia panamericana UAMH 10762]EMC95666.1 hypothetical protein BAUCODRAFT_498590 [Baudoinia panamericana UAMH 10762]
MHKHASTRFHMIKIVCAFCCSALFTLLQRRPALILRTALTPSSNPWLACSKQHPWRWSIDFHLDLSGIEEAHSLPMATV